MPFNPICFGDFLLKTNLIKVILHAVLKPVVAVKSKFLSICLNFLFASILLACFSACSRPTSDLLTRPKGFKIDGEISGKTLSENKNNLWQFSTQKTYELKACLASDQNSEPLPEKKSFAVVYPDGSSHQLVTDFEGCINWQETVDFNFNSAAAYLKKTRIIKSNGDYSGEVQIEIAVNPWLPLREESTLLKEVIDLSHSDLKGQPLLSETDESQLIEGLVNNDRSGSKILINPKLNVEIVPVRDIISGKKLRLVVRMKPYLEPKNLSGEAEKISLKAGRFKIYAQIVSANIGSIADQHILLTPQILCNYPTTLSVSKNPTILSAA